MSERVTVELPQELAERARALATLTHRPMEDVLIEWIDRAAADAQVDTLPDEEVLALCDSQIEPGQQEELSDLLARNREGLLQDREHSRLDELMRIYRRGLVRKAHALKVAVARGLKAPLN